MLNHIERHRPLVIVLAPPCASFGHWTHRNRVLHPATWEETRRVSEILAVFAARVARLQITAGRHLLLENPAGSGLCGLDCFRGIWESGEVVAVNVPQCALGFIVGGQPIYKNTTPQVSSPILLQEFQNFHRTHQRHGLLTGAGGSIARTKLAQIRFRAMCQRICNGIPALFRECRRVHLVHASDVYPVGSPRPRGRPRKSPIGVEDNARGVVYDCPACIGRLHMEEVVGFTLRRGRWSLGGGGVRNLVCLQRFVFAGAP